MDPTEDHEYILQTTDEELVRLGFQHKVLRAVADAHWAHAGFRPG